MRLVLALTTCIVLAGCGGSIQDRMIGTWKVDVDYLKDMDEFKKLPPEQQGMASVMSAMTLTITAEEIQFEMSMMGQTKKDTKPYTIKEDKGDSVVVETTQGGKKESVTVKFDGDIMIVESDGMSMPFKRTD